MKKKKNPKRKMPPRPSKVPDWVLDSPAVSTKPLKKQDLNELALGVELGIRTTDRIILALLPIHS